MSGSEPAPEVIGPYDGFLRKPFTMEQVARKVRKVLDEV